ncbi:MAG: EAL domain-containing protein [Gammaproteobacteria bacterium]|nr:EAL domain-containing protein [Gammaproteobacteria bacterium]MCP5137776.1 EAL domain-containing protein [Gammaproteobacteria bacterium]
MKPELEIPLLRKLLKQTTAAYEEKLAAFEDTQRALRASETRLSTILDTIDAYVYMKDRAGCYLYVNEITRKLWGVSNEEVIGHSDDAFFDAATSERIRVNDNLVLLEGQTVHREERNRVHGSDETRIYLSTKAPLYDADGNVEALLGVSTDITDRVHAEEQLRLAAQVYDSSGQAIIVTDADNRILATNPAFTTITGYASDEVLGQASTWFDASIEPGGFYAGLTHRLAENGSWNGEIRHRVKNDEIRTLQTTVNAVRNQDGRIEKHVVMYLDITDKKRSEEALWHQANYDELTGLPNRRLFFELLDRQIRTARRTKGTFALMFLDLDHFKEVNDTLGHHTGDELLKVTARRIHESVRETDIVARLGGDEFVVVLADTHSEFNVRRAAGSILETLRQPFQINDHTIYSSSSVGITLFPNDAEDAEGLLKNADQAMYASKQDGRSRYNYYQTDMQATAQRRMELGNELRLAIKRSQFSVVYQPIFNLATGKPEQAEALLRWVHPKLGDIPPNRFIPLAEEMGLIREIGQWVFDTVIERLHRWRRDFDPQFRININKSPIEFRDNMDCPSRCLDHLSAQRIPADSLVVEITEGLLLNLDQHVSLNLLTIQQAGVKTAIDDFGTGYSSLAYLQKLDVDYLKIDQQFVHNLSAQSTELALTEAIVVMAHRLGLIVIAEGVETATQAELLKGMGCDYAQGFHFAHPMPSDEFERRVFPTSAD